MIATAPLTVLLVDDDDDQVLLVRDMLDASPLAACRIEWVDAPAPALERLRREHFDVALIDYRLGPCTGLDLVRQARQSGCDTPLIMMTGHAQRHVDVEAMNAGVDDFLDKATLTSDILERAIRYAVRTGESNKRLRDSEKHFRALIQHASDAILLVDARGVITFASDSFQRISGYSPAEVVGSSIFARIHPDDQPAVRGKALQCLTHGGEIQIEYRSQQADGSWHDREVVAVNRLDDPAVRAVVVNYRDVTTRKRAEAQRAQLAALVQSAHSAIIGMTPDGVIQSWNSGAEQLYGHTAGEVLGQPIAIMLPADDEVLVGELLLRVGRGEYIERYQAVHVRRDGSRIDVLIDYSPVLGARGEVTGVSAVASDVTAQRRAQRALAESEEEYRALFEDSPIGMAHVTLHGRWMRSNSRMLAMLGYSAQELHELTFEDISHPDDRPRAVLAVLSLLNGEQPHFDTEKRYRRKDGSYMWARLHASLYRDRDGRPRYLTAAIEDISIRKAIEEELRTSLKRLQVIVSSMPMALWTLDLEGRVTFVDGVLAERFGPPASFIGKVPAELWSDYPAVVDSIRRALRGEPVHATVEIAGSHFETWYAPLHDDNGALAGTIGVTIDITDRITLEEQFRQAQKMEAIGRLAGGVAHDFNNLLTAIIGYAELALDEVPPSAPLRRDIEEMYKAAESAAGLTRQLLAFSRRQLLQPQTLDLNTIVDRVKSLLRRLIGEDVELVINLAPAPAQVHADGTQLEQILLNLAVNSRDAMPNGGRLTIETENVEIDDEFAAAHPGATAGRYVMLAVTDTGVGMNAETQKRVFEPFFTTKERGRGTGLGLATVYGVVKQSGGTILVYSKLGHGTTFQIFLPAVAAAEVLPQEPLARGTSLRGNETILLVEDQPEVRAIARQTLVRSGYTVLEAASPNEALALVDRSHASIHMLFTDVVMPQRSGRQLALELIKKLPDLKVIYTSGYTDSDIVNESVIAPGLAFLPKPFTAKALLTKVREVLDAPAAPQV